MKAIKGLIILLTVAVLSIVFCIPACAEKDEEYSVLDEAGAFEVFDSLDEETKEMLGDLGIDEISSEDVFKVSPKKIITCLLNVISGKLSVVLKLFFNLAVILIIQSVTKSLSNDDKNQIADITFTLLLTTAAAVPAFKAVTLACSQIMTCSSFMLSFIPVYVLLLSSSGNITSAINFNTLLFSASQFIVHISRDALLPLSGVLMSVNIASAINPVLPLNSVTSTLKKAVTVILTFISTLFIGFLSFKGTIASSVDALTVRSIRTVSGSLIPFIGSSVADAYSSVLGSLKLINNCFGFLGILTVCIIVLPVIIELLMYWLAFHFASMTAEMLNCESKKLLLNIADIISIINIIVLFVSILFTVSIGIMLKTRVG
ncbi:MAG: hypothetical protein J5877_04575 [Clostridia bacterium]|nr:hypothetical protein [Clostridia bacterium]